jgi:hypothetical protein
VIYYLLAIIVAPFILAQSYKWLIVPLRVSWRKPRPAAPDFRPTTLDDLTPEMRQFFGERIAQLAAEGFEVVINTATGSADTTLGLSIHMVHPRTRDVAFILGAISVNHRSLACCITSYLPDGERFQTAMTTAPRIFPLRPNDRSCAFSWDVDGQTLSEFHRRRLKQAGLEGSARVAPEPGHEMEWLVKESQGESRFWESRGYYWFDAPADCYRMTLKGSYLTTWRLMEPIKSWRFKRRDRKSLAEWRALGMDGFVASSGRDARAPDAMTHLPPTTTADMVDGGPLGYEVRLGKGEVSFQRSAGMLIIRSGGFTAGQFLKANWGQVASLLFWIAILAYNLPRTWEVVLFQLTLGLEIPWHLLFFTALGVFFLLYSLGSLILKCLKDRGMLVIEVTASGLEYSGLGVLSKRGAIARSDIVGVDVGLTAIRSFRRIYGLRVHSNSGSPLVLLELSEIEMLHAVHEAIAEALGFQLPKGKSELQAAVG